MEKVNDFGGGTANDLFLDCSSLTVGNSYEKVAYLVDVRFGTQVNDYAYFTLYLKDINGTRITCRMFNVKNMNDYSVDLLKMKRHCIRFKFLTQHFNGTLSLVLDPEVPITLYTEQAPVKQFMGSVSCDTRVLAKLLEAYAPELELDKRWEYSSFNDIGEGRGGAFLKLFDMTVTQLTAYRDMPNIDYGRLINVAAHSFGAFFEFKLRNAESNEVGSIFAFRVLQDINCPDEVNQTLSIDTTNCLIGLGKAKTLEGYLISSAVKDNLGKMNLFYKFSIVPEGSSLSWGGESLLKI